MDLMSHRALAAVLDTNNAWNSWFLHLIDVDSKQDFDDDDVHHAQVASEGQSLKDPRTELRIPRTTKHIPRRSPLLMCVL